MKRRLSAPFRTDRASSRSPFARWMQSAASLILHLGLTVASMAQSQSPDPVGGPDPDAGSDASRSVAAPAEDKIPAEMIQAAFAQTHEGWSADEVLVNERLNAQFVAACERRVGHAVQPRDCNWGLLQLRKSGRLTADVTKRTRMSHDAYRPAAEIAARWMEDQYQTNIDRVLCDPQLRQEFTRRAQQLAPKIEPYRLMKAALGLRKSRQLRPELVSRVADWGRIVKSYDVDEIRKSPQLVPAQPGIYLFLDHTGYLYIGEAQDLRARIQSHLASSDRWRLAEYLEQQPKDGKLTVELHVFDPDSKARLAAMRRAYESELIASRRPRWNIRP